MRDVLFDLAEEHGLGPDYASSGEEMVLLCPLCDDHKPRLYCNRRSGQWICHNCDERGTVWSFLERVLQLDPMTVYRLAREFLGTKREAVASEPAKTDAPEVELPEGSMPLDDPQFPLQQPFWRYATQRGLTPELVRRYGLMYCLTGYYAYRLIVPIRTGERLVGWIARDITGRAEKKVLAPPGAKFSQALFNVEHVERQPVLLVEGVFDAMAWPDRAVATLGAKLSPTQRSMLHKAGLHDIVVLYDGDDAGRQGSRKVARELHHSGFNVQVAQLPEGLDPGSASSVQLHTALETARSI
jgi:DNA primase